MCAQSRSYAFSHLLDLLLVQNFLHGQQLDDSTRSLVERRAFLFGVLGVAEGDEEAALSPAFAFALHDGLEGDDVGSADAVRLLHLDGEPMSGPFLSPTGAGCARLVQWKTRLASQNISSVRST